jgi:inner membrane protein
MYNTVGNRPADNRCCRSPLVDNITHTLAGAALADLALRRRAEKTERRLYTGAGVIAANLPDFDVLYSGITSQPLGYLLHHRGHTHTISGLAGLAMVLILAYRLLPPVRKMRAGDRVRLWCLIAIALASHLSLDALNSYGIHPFHPVDSSWYYGDALFIFEPWLWVILGFAVVQNVRTRLEMLAAALPILILPVTLASMGIIPPESAALLLLGGVPFAWLLRRASSRARAGIAIGCCVTIAVAMLGVSRIARAIAVAALQSEVRGRLVDVILTPNPSSPLCWSVIGIDLAETAGEYVYLRGTMSLAPRWKDPTSCASHRFAGQPASRITRGGRFALRDVIRRPLAQLRNHAERDCRAHAWLRFGRAPVLTDEAIFDLRFAERVGRNFTYLPLGRRPDPGCPSFVPAWEMPRADLLDVGRN